MIIIATAVILIISWNKQQSEMHNTVFNTDSSNTVTVVIAISIKNQTVWSTSVNSNSNNMNNTQCIQNR